MFERYTRPSFVVEYILNSFLKLSFNELKEKKVKYYYDGYSEMIKLSGQG